MPNAYEIIEGVRRAKAAQLAGHASIPAKLYGPGGGRLIREFDVELALLHSPNKDTIRVITYKDQLRWNRAEAGALLHPLPFPPIEIIEGDRGVKLEDIQLDYGTTT